jgi:hypothetical protein
MKRVVGQLLVLFLIGLLVLAHDSAVAGRGDKSGTSAAPELLIPAGARDLAMGGATVATSAGVDAIYWNPAGLSRMTKSAEAMFSHMSYIADIGVEYVAVAANFEGVGAIALSLKSIGIGDIDVTTADAPDGTGEKIRPTYVTTALTYSRLLTDRISIGLTGKVISERIERVSAMGAAFDFGVQYSGFANIGGLNIGVAVKNIGPAMKFEGPGLLREATATDYLRPATFYAVEAQTDELPSVIELGVSYRRQFDEKNSFTAAGIFQNNNLSYDEYKLGGEYAFENLFFARVGMVLYPTEAKPEFRTYGWTFGAGLHYGLTGLDITLDYAYRAVKFLDANHVVAIKLGF